jgi:hypothetical protein
MLLTRSELDYMAATDCDTGLLRPDPDAEPIVLKSRCHPDASAVLWLHSDGLIMNLACSECFKPIADVAPARVPMPRLACRECGQDEVWASYRHASGRLQLTCAGCGREIATLAVRSDAN